MIVLDFVEHGLSIVVLILLTRLCCHEIMNKTMLRKGFIDSADLKNRVIRLMPEIDLCKDDPRCYYVRALQDVNTIINEMRGDKK